MPIGILSGIAYLRALHSNKLLPIENQVNDILTQVQPPS